MIGEAESIEAGHGAHTTTTTTMLRFTGLSLSPPSLPPSPLSLSLARSGGDALPMVPRGSPLARTRQRKRQGDSGWSATRRRRPPPPYSVPVLQRSARVRGREEKQPSATKRARARALERRAAGAAGRGWGRGGGTGERAERVSSARVEGVEFSSVRQ